MTLAKQIEVDNRLAALEEQLARMEARLARLCNDLSPVTRGPGRPKKEPEAA